MAAPLQVNAHDQAEVIAFLERPDTYPGAPAVERLDTHAAIVFLAGEPEETQRRASVVLQTAIPPEPNRPTGLRDFSRGPRKNTQ